jgi:hypothetical protein
VDKDVEGVDAEGSGKAAKTMKTKRGASVDKPAMDEKLYALGTEVSHTGYPSFTIRVLPFSSALIVILKKAF